MRELEKPMYYGANQITFDKARRLRIKETVAESKLWELLKCKQLNGFKFRRQHPIETYIVDFYCHKAKLVIELDGKIHLKQKESDKLREVEIKKYGIEFLRFSNEQVLSHPEKVIKRIEKFLVKQDANHLK